MITSTQLREDFNLIIDEVETDQFTDRQISRVLTMGQMALFNAFLHPNHIGEKPGLTGFYESSRKFSEYLQPFLAEVVSPPPPYLQGEAISDGVDISIPNREIASLVAPMAVMESGAKFPMRYATNSEHAKISRMSLFQADRCNPYYTISASSPKYKVYPASTYQHIETQVLLVPEDIDISTSTGSLFNGSLSSLLVFKSCEIAGISIRESAYVNQVREQIKRIGL